MKIDLEFPSSSLKKLEPTTGRTNFGKKLKDPLAVARTTYNTLAKRWLNVKSFTSFRNVNSSNNQPFQIYILRDTYIVSIQLHLLCSSLTLVNFNSKKRAKLAIFSINLFVRIRCISCHLQVNLRGLKRS